AHGIFLKRARRLDQVCRIDEAEAELVAHEVQRLFEFSRTVPIGAPRRWGPVVADRRHDGPVRQPCFRLRCISVDGIEDEFCGIAAGDYHGSAIGIYWPLRRPAPEHGADPSRWSFMGVQKRSDPRMNSVRPDQRIAINFDTLTRVRAVEGCDHLTGSILKILQTAIGMNVRRSQPLQYGAEQHAMELAAMDAELRHRITGIDTAHFSPDGLTEPIGVDELPRANTRPIQR